jgi:molybdopterin molybdotransferase
MINFEEAVAKIFEVRLPAINSEKINFISGLQRVLAEDIFFDMDMPPFDKSAMDGYACRKADILNELEVIELIPAGKFPEKVVGKGQCSKIMTGAPIPDGADCVIIVEHTAELPNNRIKFLKDNTKSNITCKAADVKKGEKVISKGTLIKPQHIAVLATTGKHEIMVYKIPAIGIFSTGDELVEPQFKPEPSQIRNSNAYQLISQTKKLGIDATYYGIAKDQPELLYNMISKSLNENDITILTGGVSMGDYDYVPGIFNQLGLQTLFDSIAIQPGRPSTFAINGSGKYCFGLPGNPVSSFMQFELLIKPLIYRLMGHILEPLNLLLPMGADFERKKSEKLSLIPVSINSKSEVLPVEYHGSGHLNALIGADGIIFIPKGLSNLKQGDLVNVRQI